MSTTIESGSLHRAAAPAAGSHRAVSAKRLDIQGLRAVAVVVVVLNHLTAKPQGGFIGVDVFFVISGFLITSMLLKELQQTPKVGGFLLEFYRRRVRRLFPAALLVTVVSVVVAHQLFGAARFDQTRTDAIWATLFAANWHFISVGTNYFTENGAPSPFQHYWSLSVEEQFYAVWPVLLFVATLIAARLPFRTSDARRRALAGLTGAILVASYLLALRQSAATPTSAYFSTFDRAWELALGALVACVSGWISWGRVLSSIASGLGLFAIVVSLFTTIQGNGFPAPEAFLPCSGAALILLAGSGLHRPWSPFLTNPVSVWLGDISYSLYLVHWPAIVFLTAEMSTKGPYFYTSAVALSLGLSCLLYYVVERPVLRSRFLSKRQPRAAREQRSARSAERIVSAATAVALALVGVGIFTLWPGNSAAIAAKYSRISEALLQQAVSAKSTAEVSAQLPLEQKLQVQLEAALKATSWPPLNPSITNEIQRPDVPQSMVRCGLIKWQPVNECEFGPITAKHTLYVVGDSTAMAYTEAYRQMIDHMPGWNLRIGAAYGCNFDSILIRNSDTAVTSGCAKHLSAAIADINETKPTVVAITNIYAPRIDAANGRVLTDSQWTAALAAEVKKITSKSRIMLVEPPAVGTDPSECYTPHSVPAQCVYTDPVTHLTRARAEQALAKKHGWAYVNTEGLFCELGTGYCPIFVDGVPIKHDEVHIGYAYDNVMWPVLREMIDKTGVLGGKPSAPATQAAKNKQTVKRQASHSKKRPESPRKHRSAS